jgi:hypothetical protein
MMTERHVRSRGTGVEKSRRWSIPCEVLGIIQNPMFGDSTPPAWAVVLPGYAGTRTVMTAALSPHGGVPVGLVLGITAWLIGVMTLTVWRLTVELRSEH